MVSLKKELKSLPLIELDELERMHPEVDECIKNSVFLYNIALENLRLDNEDMAIIRLKKSLIMNPDFLKARILLGICYYCINEHQKATEIFEQLKSIDGKQPEVLENLTQINLEKALIEKLNTNNANQMKNREQKQTDMVQKLANFLF